MNRMILGVEIMDTHEKIINNIQQKLAEFEQKYNRIIVAIDGPSGSGKTSIANYLNEKIECNLFHMDDFFLQPFQRTGSRYAEPGGNVDYERFKVEIIDNLAEGIDFKYRKFDCRTMDFSEEVRVSIKKVNIIEGVYSHHPHLKSSNAFKIFLDVHPMIQKQRILSRNGEEAYEIFKEKWIPLENYYFDELGIREKADLLIVTG